MLSIFRALAKSSFTGETGDAVSVKVAVMLGVKVYVDVKVGVMLGVRV